MVCYSRSTQNLSYEKYNRRAYRQYRSGLFTSHGKVGYNTSGTCLALCRLDRDQMPFLSNQTIRYRTGWNVTRQDGTMKSRLCRQSRKLDIYIRQNQLKSRSRENLMFRDIRHIHWIWFERQSWKSYRIKQHESQGISLNNQYFAVIFLTKI
jgi:hypothetical protein